MQAKALSLKTFAIMAIHENVNIWSQKLNLSPNDFILNLFLPQHLITTLYVHFFVVISIMKITKLELPYICTGFTFSYFYQ